ncbi:MAG: hypothetical protein JSS29_12850 [Proteobacteria bacterium]|nr:hypothetical protein [Pseudomonadota bacterium]
MHRNRGRYAQAVSLGILTATLAGAAQAAEAGADTFVLVAYSNRTGGENLSTGDFGHAAQAVYAPSPTELTSDPQALATNRCVAYAMTGQMDKAHAACDAAVHAARASDGAAALWNPKSRHESDAASAVAYSNRAVLHWLDADVPAAQADLARARALDPQAHFIAANLTALKARQVAQNRIDAKVPVAPLAQQ